MSEKETMKDEKAEKSSEPTIEIEDLDATDTEDVKGGRGIREFKDALLP